MIKRISWIALAALLTLKIPAFAAFSTLGKKTLFVAAQRKMCTGVMPMNCLQVKWNQTDEWQLFYNEIEGFTHETGYEYTLRVREIKVKNTPADASSKKYRLVKIMDKKFVGTVDLPKVSSALPLAGQWIIEFFVENGERIPPQTKSSFLNLNDDLNKIHGNAGCNTFNGALKIEGQNLKIGPLMATKKLCSEHMEQERKFLEQLEKANTFKLEGAELTLLIDGVPVMVLESYRR